MAESYKCPGCGRSVEKILRPREVERMLGIGRTKLWELTRAGAFPAYKVGRAGIRYKYTEIMEWLNSCRI